MNGTPGTRAKGSAALCLAITAAAGMLAGCPGNDTEAPKRDPDRYRKMVSAFYTGLVALEANDPKRAEANLTQATQLFPNEPAGWADLALFYFRATQQDRAAKALEKAQSAAGNNSDIQLLAALIQEQSNPQKAAELTQKAIDLDPRNVKARAKLADLLERLAAPDAPKKIMEQYEEILKIDPGNLRAELDLMRTAARTGDRERFTKHLALLASVSRNWPPTAKQQLAALQKAAGSAAATDVLARNVQVLGNYLLPTPEYKRSVLVLGRGSQATVGSPVDHFLKLPPPSDSPAVPDPSVTFTFSEIGKAKAGWATGLRLQPAPSPEATATNTSASVPQAQADQPPTVLFPSGGKLQLGGKDATSLPFPGTATSPDSVLAIDWNDDYLPDLVLAGSGGVRIYQQTAPNKWQDVTSRSHLPAAVTGAAYTGAWAADFDLDGDLDVILGSASGDPIALQNNGDGSWAVAHPFAGVAGLRQLTWVDVDGDGVPDASMLDGAGNLAVFLNERQGHYRKATLGAASGKALALAVADTEHNGHLSLTVLRPGGAIQSVTNAGGDEWKSRDLVQWSGAPKQGTARLLWGDLDNNGAFDLVASGPDGSQVWLADAKGGFQPMPSPMKERVYRLADMDGDGRLDLVGLSEGGQPGQLINHGSKNYHWQVLRPRNARVKDADQKINAFGIGGDVELRAGLLVQKQPISGPDLHFGLGDNPGSDALRIVWPNGQPQGEFELAANSAPLANQRLTGSCPWLFADDGHGPRFVTDILWKSPLGLRINAQDTAGVSQTRDWVKIRGDQLAARDGAYDLRISAELWETDFFDYTALMVVDHPAGTEMLVDERFSIPQPELKLHLLTPPAPIVRAVDERGKDVTDLVRARDGRYLDTFALGRYQGVARDHWVEVELPESAPRTGPLYLVANGWIFPTDSSINVAISQGTQEKPRGLSLEVSDGHGGWKTARTGLGFPAGKYKTVLLDLAGLFPATGPRRVRLRTNMEVYWDALSVAAPVAGGEAKLRTQLVMPDRADLRYRGFSAIEQPRRSSPETPQYDRIAGTGQQWLDLIGFYTRFGDVRELLTKVDDRYVIMNAGDEIRLRFPAPAAPPSGWVRDFVFVSDGWDKDGNFNTTYSKTVLPLPAHDRPAYDRAPTPLEQDPVYRKHPGDWVTYQTRYVDLERFRNAMRAGVPSPGRHRSGVSQP